MAEDGDDVEGQVEQEREDADDAPEERGRVGRVPCGDVLAECGGGAGFCADETCGGGLGGAGGEGQDVGLDGAWAGCGFAEGEEEDHLDVSRSQRSALCCTR